MELLKLLRNDKKGHNWNEGDIKECRQKIGVGCSLVSILYMSCCLYQLCVCFVPLCALSIEEGSCGIVGLLPLQLDGGLMFDFLRKY